MTSVTWLLVCCFSQVTRTSTTAFVGELDRVADEIDQNLPQPDAVNQHRVRKIFGDMTFQLESFFGRRFGKQRVDEIANLAQIGRFGMQFHHARLDFRHVENVVDEQQQRVGAGADGLQILPVLRLAQIVLQQFAETQNGVHRRADFVAHVGEEDGFFLVAVFGPKFGFRQFAFVFLMLHGHVGQPQGQQSRADPKTSRDQAGQVRARHAVSNFLADEIAGPIQIFRSSWSSLGAHLIHHFFKLACGNHRRRLVETFFAGSDDGMLPDDAGLRIRPQFCDGSPTLRIVVNQATRSIKLRRQICFGLVERFEEIFVAGDDVTAFARLQSPAAT